MWLVATETIFFLIENTKFIEQANQVKKKVDRVFVHVRILFLDLDPRLLFVHSHETKSNDVKANTLKFILDLERKNVLLQPLLFPH